MVGQNGTVVRTDSINRSLGADDTDGLAGESVTESIEFSFYEFVTRFSVCIEIKIVPGFTYFVRTSVCGVRTSLCSS